MQLMAEISGEEARMFGSSIIGFGKYKYTYNSGHSGEAPLIGFSPRKNAFSLYIFCGDIIHSDLLAKLGNYQQGKSCIYAKKLSDLDPIILCKIMRQTIDFVMSKFERIPY